MQRKRLIRSLKSCASASVESYVVRVEGIRGARLDIIPKGSRPVAHCSVRMLTGPLLTTSGWHLLT